MTREDRRPASGGPERAAAAEGARRRYDRVATRSARAVIDGYSTSFGLSSRLLGPRVRGDVRNVYALVRVADEVVDGTAAAAGLGPGDISRRLEELRDETRAALRTGYSANLVVHAFALTARRSGIDGELVEPFFDSMRADADGGPYDGSGLSRYIYGSAEVVGLMCLRVFVRDEARPAAAYAELSPGARRLGAAFQKVNFLRDLGADLDGLGRRYLGAADPAALTERDKARLLDDIDDDLAAAARAVDRLPRDCRVAVAAAHGLFAALSAELRRIPAGRLREQRVRVSDPRKLAILAGCVLRGGRVAS